MEKNAHIRFDNISKFYGDVKIIEDLDLNIKKGEFISLLGPSGSGKTTLLMMLAGFESATKGTVWLNDKSLNDIPSYKRNIGVVFQNYALFPHMTVAQNIGFPLQMRGVSKADIKQKVEKVLDMVQLAAMKERKPAQLSGGQQQRVALARALVFEPEVILMDEPLGALDKQLREQMQLDIRALHQRLGVTIVFVTHDQEEALEISDQIVVMNHGKVEQVGSGAKLYEEPDNAFVTEFLGEVNRFEGYIERGELVLGVYRYQPLPPQEKWHEGTATAYIRPHEFNISRDQEGAMLQADIHHISVLGPIVRVSLYDKSGQDIEVMIPHQHHLANQFVVGERVALTPSNISVFTQKDMVDYVI